MAEVPLREQVAQGITDTIAKRYRDKRRAAMHAAEKAHRTPRFGSARSSSLSMATLSPAARRLVSNQLGIRLPSSAQHMRLVPPTRPSTSRLTPVVRASVTPSKQSSSTAARVEKPLSPITDNLMPISADESGTSQEGRCRASDFF
ncbi:hypothetical protein ANCCAN_14072 [Ancylostoma caninum]|uniref:Uncharacterized protein n=1 Tax=Ancylostoma caninum TaxID=29170 RepID=A0A368G6D8_ANCCA|nr:hypothetical protein ANCCAN_14072 [Ancylostoma caninum]